MTHHLHRRDGDDMPKDVLYPALAAGYAATCALIYVALSAWGIAGRFRLTIFHGDAGEAVMNRRIRAHGNFGEYVPFALLLTALLEARGAPGAVIHGLLAPLLLARITHPIGMLAPVGSAAQFVLRGGGAIVTLAVLAAAAFILLLRLA